MAEELYTWTASWQEQDVICGPFLKCGRKGKGDEWLEETFWAGFSVPRAVSALTEGLRSHAPRGLGTLRCLLLERPGCRGVRAAVCSLCFPKSSSAPSSARPCSLQRYRLVSNCSAECRSHTADHCHMNYSMVPSSPPSAGPCCLLAVPWPQRKYT